VLDFPVEQQKVKKNMLFAVIEIGFAQIANNGENSTCNTERRKTIIEDREVAIIATIAKKLGSLFFFFLHGISGLLPNESIINLFLRTSIVCTQYSALLGS
jgi:hypothetical protein